MIRLHRNTATALAWAGVFIVGALVLKAAGRAGWIAPSMGGKVFDAFIGLWLAAYANVLPKSLGTFRDPEAALRMQAVLRVSGWAFTLGGLGFAVTSLAPVPGAVPLAVMGAATAYVLGYAGWAFMEPKRPDPA